MEGLLKHKYGDIEIELTIDNKSDLNEVEKVIIFTNSKEFGKVIKRLVDFKYMDLEELAIEELIRKDKDYYLAKIQNEIFELDRIEAKNYIAMEDYLETLNSIHRSIKYSETEEELLEVIKQIEQIVIKHMQFPVPYFKLMTTKIILEHFEKIEGHIHSLILKIKKQK